MGASCRLRHYVLQLISGATCRNDSNLLFFAAHLNRVSNVMPIICRSYVVGNVWLLSGRDFADNFQL